MNNEDNQSNPQENVNPPPEYEENDPFPLPPIFDLPEETEEETNVETDEDETFVELLKEELENLDIDENIRKISLILLKIYSGWLGVKKIYNHIFYSEEEEMEYEPESVVKETL